MSSRVLLVRIIKNEKIRYILAGCANTVFGFAIFTTFYFILNPYSIHYIVTLLTSQAVAITSAFFVYKKFVFQTKANLFQEYMRFVSVYLFGIFLNLILMVVLVDFAKVDIILSQGVATILIVILSYVTHKNFSFKTR